MGRRILAIVVVTCCLAGSGVMLVRGGKAVWWGRQSEGWPSVEGLVIRSSLQKVEESLWLEGPREQYSPRVEYAYKVGDREYQGGRVFFSDWASIYPDDPERVVRKYPAGSTMNVFYDPEHPENSVLEPGADTRSYVVLSAGLALPVLAVSVLVIVFRRTR